MILYLHGFRSSPQSGKARLLANHFAALGRADEFVCPQLPVSPAAAIELARQLIDQRRDRQSEEDGQPEPVTLIGSSLGGFYAIWLAQHYELPAVLLNPVVPPLPDWSKQVGVWQPFHGDGQSADTIEFLPEYIDELRDLVIAELSERDRYYLVAAEDDEVLDVAAMMKYCKGTRMSVMATGGHALSNFPELIDQVVAFCDRPDRIDRPGSHPD